MILTILIVFFSLIGLIVLHELGHFLVAKKFGVKVEEFGIGFPPRIFGKKIGDTVYSLNLLPLGAFVKMPGEIEHSDDPRSFFKKPILQRIAIVIGGVVSFWIVSFIIFSFIPMGVAVSGIATSSPAEAIGLKTADVIEVITVGNINYPIFKISDAQKIINNNKGNEIILDIKRGKETLNIPVTPRVSPPQNEGALGVGLGYGPTERNYPLYQAPLKGFLRTCEFTAEIPIGWGRAISTAIKRQPTGVEIMGPVGIFNLFFTALKGGGYYFFLFLALISLYMAVFNILPIPALDGGKLLFLVIEAVRKKPVSQKIEQNLTAVFFSLLLLLMVLVTIKDVIRLF
ncbi:MAG: site-2 protease family protein [Candidatus Nealsonbacteria bacterium]|nr:site-2 protease family protein [Candidatus Nealsonbacteria bacterium]